MTKASVRILFADPKSKHCAIHPDPNVHEKITARLEQLRKARPGIVRVVDFPFFFSTFRVDNTLMEIRHLPEECSLDCPAFVYDADHPMFATLTGQFEKVWTSRRTAPWVG